MYIATYLFEIFKAPIFNILLTSPNIFLTTSSKTLSHVVQIFFQACLYQAMHVKKLLILNVEHTNSSYVLCTTISSSIMVQCIDCVIIHYDNLVITVLPNS